jgi:hypothetical protein
MEQDMTGQNAVKDAEFAAMQAIYEALEDLKEDARSRVVTYVLDRLAIEADGVSGKRSRPLAGGSDADVEEDAVLHREEAAAPKFGTFAELHDAAQPKTQADKALVAGYWLQVCQSAESFDGFSANKQLKNLGEGMQNITAAINGLKNQKPALTLQLKKSGKSRQARKTYKLTLAGIKSVEAMING